MQTYKELNEKTIEYSEYQIMHDEYGSIVMQGKRNRKEL
jgi:hypothetical protein